MVPRLVAVIPALDEEQTIAEVVRDLAPLVSQVIVVDNGSRDATAARARAAGARVVSEPRRGYGQACLSGIAAAGDAEVLLFLDGDGSDDPAQAPQVAAPVLEGRADLVIGSRRIGPREPGAHPWHAVLGTRFCVGLMNLLSGARASDLGPFRAVSREALARLDMRDRNYGWTVEMQVKAARLGLRVEEVPVAHRQRRGGRSKVSGTVRGTVGAATKIIGTILRHAWSARAARIALALAGLVITACVLSWSFGPPPSHRVAGHLALYFTAFVAYLGALLASTGLARRDLWLALAAAVLWRALLVAAPPLLSDDIHRYVWEGRVQVHGGNPYRWDDRPEAERLAHLRDEVWHGVNHKEYTAVYPPLFQLAASGVVHLHDSITAMKAFLVLCELATLGVLAALLRRRGQPAARLLVLAWSPFALVEIAGGGHNEAFGMLWLALALWALDSNRPLVSALCAAAGFAAKFLPGLIAAAWLRRYRWWHLLLAAAAASATVLPYLDAHRTLLMSLGKYARYWTFNETLFAPLALLLGHGGAVRAGALASLGLALLLAFRRTEPVAAATAVVAAVLLLSPNVLPWYGLWLLPLLVLRDEPAALLFTLTSSLAHLVFVSWLSGEPWHIGWGWRALEYLPCLLVFLLSRGIRRWSPATSPGVRGGSVPSPSGPSS